MRKLLAAVILFVTIVFIATSVSWGGKGRARSESATWEQNGGRGATWE